MRYISLLIAIYLKNSKIIGFLLGIIQLSTALTLIIGMHTLLGVFTTTLTGESNSIEFEFTDPVIIPLRFTPVNNGFLGATLDVGVGIIVGGVDVVSNSTIVFVAPRSMVTVDLELSIPLEDAREYFQEGTDLQVETYIKVATLNDLISFSNRVIIEGGLQ